MATIEDWRHPPICNGCGQLHAVFVVDEQGKYLCPICVEARQAAAGAGENDRPPAGPGCDRCQGGRILVIDSPTKAHEETCPKCGPYTPGQYRQARGVAPPRADAPSVTETIRKMRGDE